jgi:hypothetical protein
MQYLKQYFTKLLAPLEARVLVEEEPASGHAMAETKMFVISEKFTDVEMRDRIKMILELVRADQMAMDLDATYDFTFYPRTEKEFSK